MLWTRCQDWFTGRGAALVFQAVVLLFEGWLEYEKHITTDDTFQECFGPFGTRVLLDSGIDRYFVRSTQCVVGISFDRQPISR